jgi:hypothetical protein
MKEVKEVGTENELKIFGDVSFTFAGNAYLVGDEMEVKGVKCQITKISEQTGVHFERIDKPKKKKYDVIQ